jgi:hypothetical protein
MSLHIFPATDLHRSICAAPAVAPVATELDRVEWLVRFCRPGSGGRDRLLEPAKGRAPGGADSRRQTATRTGSRPPAAMSPR